MKAIKLSMLLLCGLSAGCSVVRFFKPAGPPSYEQTYAVYNQTAVKHSTSADVLAAFGRPEYETLSQSKTIIATAGKKKEGFEAWFNMVAFDENELIAKRKYVFISDEQPKQLFVEPWEGVDFDCKMVIGKDVLEQPYANENARRIAILKQVAKDARKDTSEIGADNKVIEACGMVIGQALDTVLANLDESPALADRLSDLNNGLEFEHASYDKGRVRMVTTDDIVSVDLRLGSFAKKSHIKISFDKPVKPD